MRTRMYVDDLLITCSSFEEASRARQIIEDTLLAAGIVRAPLKGCFDTPTQTLSDHLDFSISSIGKGALRVPERRCFALCRQAHALLFEAANNRRLVDSDLLRCFSGTTISCLPAVPLTRFHLREVFNAQEQYVKIFPLPSSCRQPALLAQLFRQEPREPARALARSTIYCPLHRRIGHHRLGLGVGAAPRGDEIERSVMMMMWYLFKGFKEAKEKGSSIEPLFRFH
jgi:hypothetical protein